MASETTAAASSSSSSTSEAAAASTEQKRTTPKGQLVSNEPLSGPFYALTSEEIQELLAVCDSDPEQEGFELCYDADGVVVHQKTIPNATIRLLKVKVTFDDIPPQTLHDVMYEVRYLPTWDIWGIELTAVQQVAERCAVEHYGVESPTPLKNRDFLTWLNMVTMDNGDIVIVNRSAVHPDCPESGKYVRAKVFTGYALRPHNDGKGTQLTYVAQIDPGGWTPTWIINWSSKKLAPKIIAQLREACERLPAWMAANGADATRPRKFDGRTDTFDYAKARKEAKKSSS